MNWIKKIAAEYYREDYKDVLTDQNRYTSDRMDLIVSLRGNKHGYTVTALLTHTQLGLASTAIYWHYRDHERDMARRTFREASKIIKDFIKEYEQDTWPSVLVSPAMNSRLSHIDPDHREKSGIPAINFSRYIKPAEDWRKTIYGPRYPNRDSEFAPLRGD
jgi:hypothetical protein